MTPTRSSEGSANEPPKPIATLAHTFKGEDLADCQLPRCH